MPMTTLDRIYLNQALFDHHSVDLPPSDVLTREVVNMPALLRPNLIAFVDSLSAGRVSSVGDAVFELACAGASIAADRHRAFVSAVNECRGPVGAVVFVAETPYFQILREALHLRSRGLACYLLCRRSVPSALEATFDRAFDGVLVLPAMVEFASLIGALRPRLFHIQLWMWKYHLGRLLLDASQGVPVVCEFYDITSVYASRDAMARHWGPTVVDLDLACEAEVWRRADGIISRFPLELTGALRTHLGGQGKVMEFQPWPTPEFLSYHTPKLSTASGRRHLVFAGGIIPPNDRHPPQLFPSWHMHQSIRSLLRQGFAVHVLHDPHRDVSAAPEFAPYRALQAEFNTFRLLPGVSPDRLAERLAAYDFGLVLSYMDPERSALTQQQFGLAIGTKLFSYFEAGLPVIVNAEFTRQAALVEENGLGFAVRSTEIDDLGPRVAAFDRDAAGRAVRDFNHRNAMSERIDDLVNFYDRISPLKRGVAS